METTTRYRLNDSTDIFSISETAKVLSNKIEDIKESNIKNNYTKNWKKIQYCITSNLLAFCITFLSVLIAITCIILLYNYKKENNNKNSFNYIEKNLPTEQSIWFDKGIEELHNAINIQINKNPAKNVILFIGDGMGPNTITATRIYKYGEKGLLSWEKFPYMGTLKTYCANKQVPDSFSTATALFSGIKVNYETGGVDSTVHLKNCTASLNKRHHVESILKWAQEKYLNTGFVTNTRVTHATPAALYAHISDRRWECESKLPKSAIEEGCKDIARILIEDAPGKNINVIMGGGRQCLISNMTGNENDPLDDWACYSTDGRDLIRDWQEQKIKENVKYAVLKNKENLNELNTSDVDFVLGIFANSHLKYDYQLKNGPKEMPSLKEMTLKAINILKNKKNGFLLIVEGGLIDQAHHRGIAKKALSETSALDDAVNETLIKFKDILDETLIIVTSDHAHTLTINGYPNIGNNILGLAGKSRSDNIPYTTLTYGTSYNGYQAIKDKNSEKIKRYDPSLDDITSYDYVQQATIFNDENGHGGSDVNIYAIGPMSHLFHRVHEQSYVAHVISYALQIGSFNMEN